MLGTFGGWRVVVGGEGTGVSGETGSVGGEAVSGCDGTPAGRDKALGRHIDSVGRSGEGVDKVDKVVVGDGAVAGKGEEASVGGEEVAVCCNAVGGCDGTAAGNDKALGRHVDSSGGPADDVVPGDGAVGKPKSAVGRRGNIASDTCDPVGGHGDTADGGTGSACWGTSPNPG